MGFFRNLFAEIADRRFYIANFGVQALGLIFAWIYSFVVTLIILKILDRTMGLRISEQHEIGGLNSSQHGEAGYSF
ncbi:MAG: hypothetical protein ACUVWO_11560 [Thermodesulfobacteriota bacterium]